jgi:hypothetical protein
MIFGIMAPILIFYSIILLQNNQVVFDLILSIQKQIHYLLLTSWEWLILGLIIISFILAVPIIGSFTIATRKYYTYLFFCILILIPSFVFLGIAGRKPYGLSMTLANFYILPFFLKMTNIRLRNLTLFFGLIGAIFATFVQFK